MVPRSFRCAPEGLRLPGSDACRLAHGRDALMRWRALFERSELVRPPQAGVHPLLMRPDGASLVLGPFAPQQWCALRDAPSNPSPAGAKPGNTKHHVDTRIGYTRARHSPASAWLLANPKMDFQYTSSSSKARTINSE
jgi:hypothetical protein